MTARRIADIIIALMRAKKAGAKLTGKSALERELQAWIGAPSVKLSPIINDYGPIIAPEPFDALTLEELQLICRKRGGYIKPTYKPVLPAIES